MTLADTFIALFVQALWGLNFVAAKIGIENFPPLFLMAVRFALVAILLAPFAPKPTAPQRWRLFWLGVTLGTFHFPLMFVGLSGIDASTAAIVGQLQVPFSSLLAAIFFKDRLGWKRAFGMALAFAGIVLIAGEPRLDGSLVSLALLIGAALAFAAATIQMKTLGPVNPFTVNGWVGLVAAPPLALLSFTLEDGQAAALAQASWQGWAALAFMVVVSSIIAHGTWYVLLRRYDVNQTVPFILTLPMFAVIASVAFLGESLTATLAVGGALTVVGVAVILFRRPRLIEQQKVTSQT